MAVQSDYGTSSFEPDLYNRGVVARTTQIVELPACTALLGYNNINSNNINNMKKFSGEEAPQISELTYHASASLVKKRARDNNPFMAFQYPPTFSADVQLTGVPPPKQTPMNPVQIIGSYAQRPVKQPRLMDSRFNPIAGGSTFLRPLPVCGNAMIGVPQMNTGYSTLRGMVTGPPSINQTRLVGTGSPSTSGRPTLPGSGLTGIDREITSILQQHTADTNKIFQLEVQKIILAFEEESKLFQQALMTEIAKGPAMQWLVQKEAELEVSTRRNAELEQRLSQLSAENQNWISIARNNESIVNKLHAQMEHAVKNGYDKNVLEEGMGDTDEVQSTCRDDTPVAPFACRVCRKDTTRLVFPCRHLCLCDACDAMVSACPVCNEPKLSSIPVLFT